MRKYTETQNMLIIRDLHGEIIGAQVEDPTDGEIMTFITPAKPEHTLHRVWEVPTEICNLADPIEFHRAITDHVKSERAKVTRTSAEELQAGFSRVLDVRKGEEKRAL